MRWILVMLAACGGGSGKPSEYQAVGTYIGGGSILFGPDECTYTGAATVFDDLEPKPGPRVVRGAGTITVTCPKTTYTVEALAPTSAQIHGPSKVAANATSEMFQAYLYAGDRELRGEPTLEWTLSKGCDGIATFGSVLGSQDTGGPDRTRKLVTTGKGKCQIDATLTIGEGDLPPKSFQASTLVTIE